jgi:hypothetical protein
MNFLAPKGRANTTQANGLGKAHKRISSTEP